MPLSLVTAAWATWRAANVPRATAKPKRELAAATLKLSIRVPRQARTAETLGTEREGTGVVIDPSGFILTIGYLLLEAESVLIVANDGRVLPATVAGFDHATGFGLVRTSAPLQAPALALGTSADAYELVNGVIATHPAAGGLTHVTVVGRRAFTGWWEYAIEGAIFTAPARDNHSGAALINDKGELIGIGSLWVGDAIEVGAAFPGNMFVPIDLLKPILDDLKANGRRSGKARPWLGVYTEVIRGHLVLTEVLRDSPAERAGLKRGDVVLAVAEQKIATQADFYRALWSCGAAGIHISLQIWRNKTVLELVVRSVDRMEYFRPWAPCRP
jgi:S1-C subfamily serine protease